MPMPPTIWWIRRDLRLADNPALASALAAGGPVIPLFVLDPALLASRAHGTATARQAFLFGGLRALDRALRARGTSLVVRHGAPAEVLDDLVAATGACRIVAIADVSPFARRRDAAVRRRLPLELVDGVAVHTPGTVLTRAGTPFTVFTPFARAWAAQPTPPASALLPAPRHLPGIPGLGPDVAALPTLPLPAAFPPGEDEALRRLTAFASEASGAPIDHYDDGRNRLDLDGTSSLSPYLRFGMISPRTALLAAGDGDSTTAGRRTWVNELVWRDFYLHVLWHFPEVLRHAFNPALRRIPWRDAPDDLAAWQTGRTGYPVVDAAMRQLQATGWMHNRARMIVASFLTKDLLIDWRAGEVWFLSALVDGDPAANNGGWQWSAGTGTDAAPYFRIFNPTRQAHAFDPDGAYVRTWVPELRPIDGARVHEPWKLSPPEQRALGVEIGRDYPAPIVDHAAARVRTLAAYAASRQG